MAHVYGHCDFFKNNYWFSQTNRKMMDEMANHGNRVRRYMDEVGVEEVEEFIDACLSIEDLIDIHSPFIQPPRRQEPLRLRRRRTTRKSPTARRGSGRRTTWTRSSIRAQAGRGRAEADGRQATRSRSRFPTEPMRDVMLFLLEHAPLKRLAGRRALDHPRRSLLLRPAGPDQDHERRLGQLLALARS